MATLYSDIYNVFISKIADYDLAKQTDEDKNLLLRSLLYSACNNFVHICRRDLLDRDENTESFTEDLEEDVIEIISELMIVEWLKPKLYFSENLKNVLNTKDFNQFSPANLLKEMRETYKDAKLNAKKLMIDYSYREDISD